MAGKMICDCCGEVVGRLYQDKREIAEVLQKMFVCRTCLNLNDRAFWAKNKKNHPA